MVIIDLIIYFKFYSFQTLSKTKVILITLLGVLLLGIASISLKERFLFETESKLSEVLTKEEFGKVYLWTGSSITFLQLMIFKEQLEEESIFWKGFGLFASRENLKIRHLKFNSYFGFHDYNYHNQYAQVFAEIGILGLILICTMLYQCF